MKSEPSHMLPATQPATRSMALLTAVAALAAAALAGLQGLYFPAADALPPAALCLCLAAVAGFYRFWRDTPAFVLCLKALVVLVAFSTVFAILSYAIAASDRPWADATLAWCDHRLGLSSDVLVGWVAAWPAAGFILKLAYFSIIPQTILAIVYLGLGNQQRRLDGFLVRFMLCGLITAVAFFFFPARGICASYRVPTPEYYRPILAHLDALRSGARTLITWRDAEGLITFPSFHAIWGVLLVSAFWRTRWWLPVTLLNALMIVSTVPIGMHYFTDVLGGLTVAATVLYVTRRQAF